MVNGEWYYVLSAITTIERLLCHSLVRLVLYSAHTAIPCEANEKIIFEGKRHEKTIHACD